MTDAIRVLPPGWRALDANGAILSGASLEFYNAGTTNGRTVYSDDGLSTSLGDTVACNAGGYPVSGSNRVLIYTGTGQYKIILKNAAGVEQWTHDNIRGALDTSNFQTISNVTDSVNAVSANRTIATTDRDRLYNVDSSGASRTITLLSAVTAGNGFRVGIRHNGTANSVTIRAAATQTINGIGSQSSAITLHGRGETVWLVSDDVGWTIAQHVPPFLARNTSTTVIEAIRQSPPSSPAVGSRYIVSSNPSGTWSTIAVHTVVEADGLGGWIQYPAQIGWSAFNKTDDTEYQYLTTGWKIKNQDAIEGRFGPAMRGLILEEQRNGYALFPGIGWQKRTLNVEVTNTISGATFNAGAGTFTLSGSEDAERRYLVLLASSYYHSGTTAVRLSGDNGTLVYTESQQCGDAYQPGLFTMITLTANETFEFQAHASRRDNPYTYGTNFTNIKARATIIEIVGIAGPAGGAGPVGPNTGLDYQWSTTTTGDPGSGLVGVNHATLISATQLRISNTDRNSSNLSSVIQTWDDSTNRPIRGSLRIFQVSNRGTYIEAQINGAITAQTDYLEVPITVISAVGPISVDEPLAVMFDRAGDRGVQSGAEVALTDAASIALDLDSGVNFNVTLGGDRTLANPTNGDIGQSGRIRVIQDATGSRTLSFGTQYEFAGGTEPTLSTAANAEDVLVYDRLTSSRILIRLDYQNVS